MRFSIIRTWLYGMAKLSNIPALVALIRFKFIYLAILCILPAIDLFIDQDSHVTGQYSSIIPLSIKCLVILHTELGDNTLTHSVLLLLDPLIPLCFHYIDCHQPLFNLLL